MNLDFCTRLRRRDPLFGTIVSIDSSTVMEIVASAGFDWIFVEAEHTANDLQAVERLLVAAGDTPCLIRLPSDDPTWIKRTLDLGATGIIVPQVNTVEQARAIARAARYAPAGERGVGAGRASGYGANMAEYLANANLGTAVLVQAEHVDAVANASAIAAVDGIDGAFVGPFDLSASMGLMGQIDHPDVIRALESVRTSFDAVGKPCGYYGPDTEQVKARLAQGFSILACSMDVAVLRVGISELAAQLRDN